MAAAVMNSTMQSAAIPARQKSTGVLSNVVFGSPPEDAGELYYVAAPDRMQTNTRNKPQQVLVQDLRRASGSPMTLAENGFQLEHAPAPVLDWASDEQVKALYHPALEELIKRLTGATRVHIVDTTFRKGFARHSEEALKKLQATKIRDPVPQAHVDYTLKSGPQRLRQVLPDEAEALSTTPFAIIQVWRALKGPVDEAPLALADSQSLDPADLMEVRLEFPSSNPRSQVAGTTGYTYSVRHNPGQRWWYARGMSTDEVMVFKTYDSRRGVPRFVPHAAFQDPTTPAGAPARESIEVRAFAFWENEAPQEVAMDF